MADLIINEAFNMFVGPAGQDNSKHLIIKNLKLPEMEEITQAHHSGGSWGELEVGGLGMKKLMASMKSTGWDAQSLGQFGINGQANYPFTAYSNARSKATGVAVPIKAVMWGRLTKVAVPEMKRGELLEFDYEIQEMTHYELWYAQNCKYFWDWATTKWYVDGILRNADEITNLSIPTGGASTIPA